MLKFSFLINPISGGGQGKSILKFVPEIMHSMDFDDAEWKAELTEGSRLREQIRECAEETETLIAVGGDGTMSTILSVMLESGLADKVRLGLIPLGTGNDLARVLNLYETFVNKGLLFLVRKLVQARHRPFDIWKVNGKFVLANYFSSGIDARIAHDFNADRASGKISSSSVLANKMHYVKRFFADRRHCLGEAELRFCDKEGCWKFRDVSGFRTVIVGNIPSFASGANPFDGGDMADGLLEVVPVPHMNSFFGALALGTFPLVGKLYKRFFLKTYHAKEIILRTSQQEFHQLDGDDLTHRVGSEIRIEYGCRVQMLTLEPGNRFPSSRENRAVL